MPVDGYVSLDAFGVRGWEVSKFVDEVNIRTMRIPLYAGPPVAHRPSWDGIDIALQDSYVSASKYRPFSVGAYSSGPSRGALD